MESLGYEPQIPQVPMERGHIKADADEYKSRWVQLHTGKRYLLPVVHRYQRLAPKFGDDGTVHVDIESENSLLAPVVGNFLELLDEILTEEKTLLFASEEMFHKLFDLARRLLLVNYDMTNDDLGKLFTVSSEQFKTLAVAIINHVKSN